MEEEEADLQTCDSFKTEKKAQRLSLHLLVTRHLPPEATSSWDQEKILTALCEITHVRLDRENISHIDSLELLSDKVTNVYLQQNRITCISNLDCLKNLQFLTLAGNLLQKVENLSKLSKLLFLDLSDNRIAQFDIDEFPQSLILLNLSGNPCTQMPDYRGCIIQDLHNLQQLDNVDVTREEREEAGYPVSSEEDSDETEEEPRRRMMREHEVDGPLQSLTSEVLMRSQTRLEESLADHRRHNMELDNIRLNWKTAESDDKQQRKKKHNNGGFRGVGMQ
ncbi:leucine-rich repeat-containing protein 46-like [Haliotis rubra]|uniref:leucine-rich repeat-containing protein 46-like n=1 Tax=Haliotis rubra TaxID=36100 RepID=UPI001EE57F50|nr:leucine-rich repeat-containing protein 46-like [Haliotis rubra]